MTLNITHRGIELTPAIKAYVEEKMASLEKYSADIRHADVEVGMTNKHHQKGDIFECRVVLQVEGDVMRIEREAEDLYKSIDKVRDHLRVELVSRKERLNDKKREG
ncbi:MAG: ribosome-associated translation inhibitor RaiA [bacterium]|nr:ribosome-associated translation inhibitor RaiA [bacterium]